ncbi:hypothetical protein NM208_g3435 [Fusarium decemcellulare]|uniref:Uncharacterized protein n=1 Tax=Fusarium decemcellulare TaxID=57161 RepID=A0ACC1SPA8_9HYPO|nr:hypothetical protein NM208_g3435 [Fusarium decemcellulare]
MAEPTDNVNSSLDSLITDIERLKVDFGLSSASLSPPSSSYDDDGMDELRDYRGQLLNPSIEDVFIFLDTMDLLESEDELLPSQNCDASQICSQVTTFGDAEAAPTDRSLINEHDTNVQPYRVAPLVRYPAQTADIYVAREEASGISGRNSVRESTLIQDKKLDSYHSPPSSFLPSSLCQNLADDHLPNSPQISNRNIATSSAQTSTDGRNHSSRDIAWFSAHTTFTKLYEFAQSEQGPVVCMLLPGDAGSLFKDSEQPQSNTGQILECGKEPRTGGRSGLYEVDRHTFGSENSRDCLPDALDHLFTENFYNGGIFDSEALLHELFAWIIIFKAFLAPKTYEFLEDTILL